MLGFLISLLIIFLYLFIFYFIVLSCFIHLLIPHSHFSLHIATVLMSLMCIFLFYFLVKLVSFFVHGFLIYVNGFVFFLHSESCFKIPPLVIFPSNSCIVLHSIHLIHLMSTNAYQAIFLVPQMHIFLLVFSWTFL